MSPQRCHLSAAPKSKSLPFSLFDVILSEVEGPASQMRFLPCVSKAPFNSATIVEQIRAS
jgi:hypothetical protein